MSILIILGIILGIFLLGRFALLEAYKIESLHVLPVCFHYLNSYWFFFLKRIYVGNCVMYGRKALSKTKLS